VVEQFAEPGGQVFIMQEGAQAPRILAQDSTVLPIKSDLIPDPVPADIASTLSGKIKPSNPHPTITSIPKAASDDEAAQRVFTKATECDETLITRNIPDTRQGRVACAFAVNEVVRQALGKPIGGGLSTSAMGVVLRNNHTQVDGSQAASGNIVIAPTQGGNVGHVGIVGAIKSPRSNTTIFSNSSSRGVFSHKFTMGTWNNFYRVRKGLPVLFFALQAKNLGK
jgi:hypothetical protein